MYGAAVRAAAAVRSCVPSAAAQRHHVDRIYRGDWVQGVMHGCGTRIWKDPDGSMQAAEGKFFGNEFVGDIMPCGGEDGLEAAVDADMAAFQARSFLVSLWSCKLTQHNYACPMETQWLQRWLCVILNCEGCSLMATCRVLLVALVCMWVTPLSGSTAAPAANGCKPIHPDFAGTYGN